MKHTILLILSLGCFGFAQAQESTVQAESTIERVNLFLDGAQIQRKADFKLKKGINRIVIDGLTAQLDAGSVKVGAEGDFIILSVSGNSTVSSNPKKLPIIEMLEDSIDILEYALKKEQNKEYVLNQKESLILANKDLKGDKGVILIDLEDALIIYEKQLTAIKQGQLDSKLEQIALRNRLNDKRKQLKEFKRSNQKRTYQLIVKVSAESAIPFSSMSISYFVKNARWRPLYDLRVKDLESPVTLKYKAEVVNSTGENWDNVKLHLSSGNPNLSGVPPVLNPQRLYYNEPSKVNRSRGDRNAARYNSYRNTYMNEDGYAYNQTNRKKQIEVNQSLTSFEFDLNREVQVLADGKALLLDLMDKELGGKYSYFSVPKKDQGAFLLTSITGWEELSLLLGEANVYFENTYLGKTMIDPSVTTDTLHISLGRDKGVVVERRKLKEFCSSNFSGSRKKEILMYEITVKNTKQTAIQIEILDQIPVCSNKDIDVEDTETSDAEYNENSGELKWIKTIPPGATVKIRIGYEIKYPKDKVLRGL